MGLNYYASSPTLVLPPQQHPHCLPDNHNSSSLNPTNMSWQQSPLCAPMPSARTIRPTLPHGPPSLNYLSSSPKAQAGRKRSRCDADESAEDVADGSRVVESMPKPKAEPVYGPGMTLIYPDEPALNITEGSQSGTWVEQKDEQEKTRSQRPRVLSRKSQRRLDTTTASPRSAPVDSPQAVTAPPQHTTEALLDQLAMQLGVGWKRVRAEEAKAGWEAFIKNHYDLDSPNILLQNTGQDYHLVHAAASLPGLPSVPPGFPNQVCFWLFRNDMRNCQRLTGETVQDAAAALTHTLLDECGAPRPHILLDGPMLYAQDRSRPVEHQPPSQLIVNDGMDVDGDVEMEL